ncbi:ribokinase [Agromyces kandeliae]|uniref:Ribokinase n=1 Tax=Agromyces kandeliae TaxID=2666141 RepID=A0A6L5R056_9MICO|nr:ribokinase [Agromyces kandeliae]MRX43329.1 ribokinase [Agromyces kandeliae]
MSIASGRGGVHVVGSANVDIVVAIERVPRPGETLLGAPRGRRPGGKGFNQAVAARRVGAATSFSGAVGDDADGDAIARMGASLGIDLCGLERSPSPTGLAEVFLLPGGENCIVVAPGANLALSGDKVADGRRGVAVVLAQLEIPLPAVEAVLAAGRRHGALTILNAAPARDDASHLLRHADVVVVNEVEARALGGHAAILAAGARAVVVTMGAAGSRIVGSDGLDVEVPAFPVDVVDTTGAGDAFCGALAAALADGASLPEAALRGSAAGSITAGELGAQTDVLTRAAIDARVGIAAAPA